MIPSKSRIIDGQILQKKDMGGILFIRIDSRGQEIDTTAGKKKIDSDTFESLKSLHPGDYCRMEVVEDGSDLLISRLTVHVKIQKNYIAWDNQSKEILRAYAYILQSLREFFTSNDYCEVRLPTIHFGKTDGDIFSFDFFGKTARLTSSNSLFLNVYAVQLQKAFSVQKCFRAEKSHTNRHLAEFDMLEAAGFNLSLADAMALLERALKHCLGKFHTSSFAHLSPLNFDRLIRNPFPTITYEEVARTYSLDNKGLGKFERKIATSQPTFVTYFPKKVASWTARPLDDIYSRSFNLLLPGVGEAAEGTEKQTNKKWFSEKLRISGMEEQLGWYLNMIPYSDFSLSEFGLGIERLAMWILGVTNIRHINPVFRDTRFSEIPK